MKDIIFVIFSSVTVSAMLTAILIWLSKTWISERLKNAIKHEYDAKLEQHKAELQAVNAIQVERLKANLQVAAATQSVKFSSLHEKRLQVIAELYALIERAYGDANIAIALAERNPNEWHTRDDAIEEVRRAYAANKLYFSAALASTLESLITDLCHPQDYQYLVAGAKDEDPAKLRAEHIARWKELRPKIDRAKEMIANEFRGVLGVEEPGKPGQAATL